MPSTISLDVNTFSPTEMELFQQAMGVLMKRRGLKQADLAKKTGLSSNTISAYMIGRHEPRGTNLKKIISVLCVTPDEEQYLWDAAMGIRTDPPAQPTRDPWRVEDTPMEQRAEAMGVAKAISIKFRNDVERELRHARIPMDRDRVFDVGEGLEVVPDFISKGRKNRIILECKARLEQDWQLVLGLVAMYQSTLNPVRTVVVIPYHTEETRRLTSLFENSNATLVTFPEMVPALKELGA